MISKEKNNNKFLFILGPTGIGKTFVSLNISKKLNGIIINSDAFSLYKEADVMTAKATEEEKKISVHKLIDVLDLTEINFNQNDYKHLFFNEIKNEENKIFIIVGGTNYYVESVLFKENPRYIVYHELVYTTKEYMRYCIEVKAEWLLEIAPFYFNNLIQPRKNVLPKFKK